MSNSPKAPLLENDVEEQEQEQEQEQERQQLLHFSGETTKEAALSSWILEELKKQFWLAVPMVCVSLLFYSLNLVSIMFVGHLGELELASSSLATSFASVTGHSMLMGLASGLETLCGQAYGAKQYRMLGIYLQRAVVCLWAVALPMAFVWSNMGLILRWLGQDPEIADYAGQYARWMVPSLFANATLQPLLRFLLCQGAVLPMACCSALTLCFHIPTCWFLVMKTGFGYRGGGIAIALSQWMNVLLIGIYIKIGSKCSKTWEGFSSEAFRDITGFFSLALPAAVMVCLEYWAFEFVVLFSGWLPNPKLETSAVSISMNTMSLVYMVPYGIGASASTRVSNELGAGRASWAKKAAGVAVCFGLTEGLIMSAIGFSLRDVWAYAFTNEAEVVEYISALIPFLATLAILDACQAVLSGVARGCGRQALGAYCNLGAFYGVGLPVALILAFHAHLEGKGLWIGMMSAVAAQLTAFGVFTIYADWDKEAQKAVERVGNDRLPIKDKAVSQVDLS